MCYNDSFDPSLNAKRLMECGERVRDSACEEDCSLWCSWKIRKSRYILAVTFFLLLLLLAMFFKVFKKLNRKAKSSNRNVRRRSRKKTAKLNSKANKEWKTKQRFASTTCTDTSRKGLQRFHERVRSVEVVVWRKFQTKLGNLLFPRFTVASSSVLQSQVARSLIWVPIDKLWTTH